MKRTTFAIVVLLAWTTAAWGSGFRIPEQGAAAMGMSNAWVAIADGPSAVFMNPAGILQLGGPSLEVGVMAIQPGVDHTDQAGASTSVESNWYYPVNLYATDNMGTSNWAFGIGVSTPFGLGTEWSKDSFARYSSTLTEIQLINVNPALAYKVSDSFLLAVGADYYRSTVTLKRQVPWGLQTYLYTGDPASLAIPDGSFRLKGDGDGWGWNVGTLVKMGPNYSLGFTYRSSVEVEYEGDADLTNIGGVGQSLYGGASYHTTGTATIEYPAMAQLGFAAKITPAVTLEFDIDWTQWSSYDKLEIDFKEGITDSTSTKDWDDAICYRLGLNWALGQAWDLRAGLLYDNSPIPDEHYDTLLPDGDYRYGGSIGFGYQVGSFRTDFAYLGLVTAERTISQNNPEYNTAVTDIRGTYEGFTSLFSLNLSYLF